MCRDETWTVDCIVGVNERSEMLNCAETRHGMMTVLLMLMRSEMLRCAETRHGLMTIVDVNEK